MPVAWATSGDKCFLGTLKFQPFAQKNPSQMVSGGRQAVSQSQIWGKKGSKAFCKPAGLAPNFSTSLRPL